MKVLLDKPYAASIRKAIIDDYEARAKEGNKKRDKEKLWHVSDLVFPRKAYFELLYGRKITDEAIGFWFTGVAFHTELQRILGIANAEKEVKKNGVIAHIDHFDKVLLEIKTSRKWTIPKEPEPHYVRQAGYYSSMTGTLRPKIVVIYPTAGRKWDNDKSSTVEIGAWELVFTKGELDLMGQDMAITISEIEQAVMKKDPSGLPPVPSWLIKDYVPKQHTRKELWAMTGRYNYNRDKASPFNYMDIGVEYEAH
jgi:hypothetical protein